MTLAIGSRLLGPGSRSGGPGSRSGGPGSRGGRGRCLFHRLFGGLFCGFGGRGGGGLLFAQLKVLAEVLDGVLLGVVLHHKIELLAGEHRLRLFGLAAEALLQQRGQVLAAYIQVFGDLVQFNFFDHLSKSSSSSLIIARIPPAKFSSQTARMPVFLPV